MAYTERGQDPSRAWHEVLHYLAARDCGLAVTCMSIDIALARRECGERSGGFCTIPDLHCAPLFDQITVYRAGIVGADVGGFGDLHAGAGDFYKIRKLLDAAGVPGYEQNAVCARADRRAAKIFRDHRAEAQQLVARLIAERTITFDSPTAVRTIPWSERRAAMDAKYGRAAVDAELLKFGYTHLVTPGTEPQVMVRKATMPLLIRSASTRSTSFDPVANTIDVIWTTGQAVRRTDSYGEPFDEVLATGPNNVRLDRLNAGAPFLNSHNSGSLDAVLGVVVKGSARVENGQGLATIKLSSRKEVAGAVLDLADGIITGVSCGYRYHKVERTEGDGVPEWRVVDWEPLEISACAVQADAGAQVRDGEQYQCEVRG